MITRSSFSARYKKAEDELEARLEDYLRSQGEDEVHRLRTAIRRFDRGAGLLPASVRKRKQLRRYRSRIRKLLRANNRIRDLDTIRSHLSPMTEDPRLAWLQGMLRSERSGLEGPARQAASSIGRAPAVDWEKVTGRKLRRRFRKANRRMIDEIERDLGTVLKDPDDLQALHSLRVTSKELRYTMEFAAKGEVAGDIARGLRGWQDTLGMIRDIDNTTAYLGGLELSRDLAEVLQEKREQRRRLYLRFVDANKRSRLPARMRSAVAR